MSSKYSGYMGRVILINLTDRTVKPYPWSDEERRLFMGGKIMAAKILSDTLTGREEPFSEENLLIVSTGPLTETGVPSSGRFNISTISPLTGITTSSNCGGNFGYYMKKAGYDAIIFRGVQESIRGFIFITIRLPFTTQMNSGVRLHQKLKKILPAFCLKERLRMPVLRPTVPSASVPPGRIWSDTPL